MALSIPTIPLISFESQNQTNTRLKELHDQGQSFGSLGSLAVRLAGVRGERSSFLNQKRMLFMGGDYQHQGGNRDKTEMILTNLLSNQGAIAEAKAAGFELVWADIGLQKSYSGSAFGQIQPLRVGQVKDMALGAALSLPEVQDAVWVGMNIASQEIANGMDLALPLNIGWGAELAAAAITTVFKECDPKELLPENLQSGLSNGAARELILRSIEINQPDRYDPLDVLRCVGGADICALVGVALVAAAGQVPIILDSFVSASAALAASYLTPAIRSYLFAGARPYHPGLTYLYKTFGLNGMIDLGGPSPYGLGGILTAPIMESALRLGQN